MWRKIWKKLDHFSRATLPSLVLSTFWITFLILMGEGDSFLLSEWYLDFLPIPFFVASQLSAATAVGRALDIAKSKNEIRKHKWEFTGIILGISVVAIIGVALAVITHVAQAPLTIIKTALYMYGCINTFANFGMRVGRMGDENPDRPPREKVWTAVGAILGLGLGIVLAATMTATLVSVIGITSFLTGGLAVPLWLGGIAFALHLSSSVSSAAYYTSRTYTFYQSETPKGRENEYEQSKKGVTRGFVIGVILIAAVLILQPHVLVGVVGVIAATLAVLTCVSVIGGLHSRYGRFKDKYLAAKKQVTESIDKEPEDTLSSGVTLKKSPKLNRILSPLSPLYYNESVDNPSLKKSRELNRILSPLSPLYYDEPTQNSANQSSFAETSDVHNSNRLFSRSRGSVPTAPNLESSLLLREGSAL